MAKADDFERKAEKKLNSWGLFSSKYEDAADLYEKAGNCYKLAKTCNSLILICMEYLQASNPFFVFFFSTIPIALTRKFRFFFLPCAWMLILEDVFLCGSDFSECACSLCYVLTIACRSNGVLVI